MKFRIVLCCYMAFFIFQKGNAQPKPVVDGDWWQVATNPDVGDYTSENQEPVDFGIWQAADGTWQIWSCIRGLKNGGKRRLFYRWEGKNLTDRNWKHMGIAMEADTTLSENKGGLQAPYVFKRDGTYYMFYGDWNRICLATSKDGKEFTRVDMNNGEPDLFEGPYLNTRDAMVMIENGLFYCYYTGHTESDGTLIENGEKVTKEYKCAIFCRTSADFKNWSEPVMVSAGGSPLEKCPWFGGDSECPFVVKRDGYYILFRNQAYGPNNWNTQYASKNPFNFGVGNDDFMIGTMPVAAPEIFTYQGQDYMAALNPGLDGIRITKLKWESEK